MSTPCEGELQFWSVMRSQMSEIARQVTRIADALEARNYANGIPAFADIKAMVDSAKKELT